MAGISSHIADFMAVGFMGEDFAVATFVDAALIVVSADGVFAAEKDSVVNMGSTAADFAAGMDFIAVAASTVEKGSTVAEGFMVVGASTAEVDSMEAAVDFTVAEATADAGNTAR